MIQKYSWAIKKDELCLSVVYDSACCLTETEFLNQTYCHTLSHHLEVIVPADLALFSNT